MKIKTLAVEATALVGPLVLVLAFFLLGERPAFTRMAEYFSPMLRACNAAERAVGDSAILIELVRLDKEDKKVETLYRGPHYDFEAQKPLGDMEGYRLRYLDVHVGPGAKYAKIGVVYAGGNTPLKTPMGSGHVTVMVNTPTKGWVTKKVNPADGFNGIIPRTGWSEFVDFECYITFDDEGVDGPASAFLVLR